MEMNTQHHVLDYILVSVFNMYLDPYSLLLLSNTSKKSQQTYKTTQATTILYMLKVKHKAIMWIFDEDYFGVGCIIDAEYISNLLREVFITRFGDSISNKKALISTNFRPYDHHSVFLACMYDGSLSFLDYIYVDYGICRIELQLDMLYDVLELYEHFELYEESTAVVTSFAESEFMNKCMNGQCVFEYQVFLLLQCCYHSATWKTLSRILELEMIMIHDPIDLDI